ncbi:hypothetical protein [Actinacidiphila oryziradicis]|jgi:hypothetical protein|uniref:hypothetical protein n=1 Tax=Actinacidiphila oryziradicis TaxID=2571141 RepID=UPI0023F035DC|nr:hypothetical protein [Actinacidiphila oryziradicis]MCW2870984.1 hypothetical protein [Actinacidiphila oryziradicis]MDX6331247.1 hypothetical protein [Streptomycetaceae bacterium]
MMFGLVPSRRYRITVTQYENTVRELNQLLVDAYSDHLNDLARAERARLRLTTRLERAVRGCDRYRAESASHLYLVRFLCGYLVDADPP